MAIAHSHTSSGGPQGQHVLEMVISSHKSRRLPSCSLNHFAITLLSTFMFVQGQSGINMTDGKSCPAGSDITAEQDCKDAADTLGLSFHAGDWPWDDWHRNCFRTEWGGIYFNKAGPRTTPVDEGPGWPKSVCRGSYVTAPSKEYCTQDTDIASEEECREAANAWGFNFVPVYRPSNHRNCYYTDLGVGTMYFNKRGTAASATPFYGYRSLCKASPGAMCSMSSFVCPSTMVFTGAGKHCAGPTCDQNVDKETCCTTKAMCSSFVCPATMSFTGAGKQCAGSSCDQNVDVSNCCTGYKFDMHLTLAFPFGEKGSSHAAEGCSPTTYDKEMVSSEMMVMPHEENFAALNSDSFIIEIVVTAQDETYPHSVLPLYLGGENSVAGTIMKDDVGFSMLAGPSRDILEVRMSNGTVVTSQQFSYPQLQVHAQVMFQLACWKTLDGRDCEVLIDGTLHGVRKPFAVAGEIYDGSGGKFGMVSGWKFAGILHTIAVCRPQSTLTSYDKRMALGATMSVHHTSAFDTLNSDAFILEIAITPQDLTYPRSILPFYLGGENSVGGTISKDDTGFSMLVGPSQDILEVRMSNGTMVTSQQFSFPQLRIHERVMFQVACSKTLDGRDCEVRIDGTLHGTKKHFAVSGQIYDGSGGKVGMVSGWSFTGILHMINIMPGIGGDGSQAGQKDVPDDDGNEVQEWQIPPLKADGNLKEEWLAGSPWSEVKNCTKFQVSLSFDFEGSVSKEDIVAAIWEIYALPSSSVVTVGDVGLLLGNKKTMRVVVSELTAERATEIANKKPEFATALGVKSDWARPTVQIVLAAQAKELPPAPLADWALFFGRGVEQATILSTTVVTWRMHRRCSRFHSSQLLCSKSEGQDSMCSQEQCAVECNKQASAGCCEWVSEQDGDMQAGCWLIKDGMSMPEQTRNSYSFDVMEGGPPSTVKGTRRLLQREVLV